MHNLIRTTKTVLLIAISISFFACKSDLTNEIALEQLVAQPEFKSPFFAPFHVGDEILNGEDHRNSDKYIKEHLGSLIEAGLLEAKVTEKNSWRSVLNIQLTEAGTAMIDPKRSTDKSMHVMVCRVTPTEITEIREIALDKTYEVDFIFTESEVTPFGSHLGFENGKKHKDTRTFVRMGMGWEIKITPSRAK